MTETVTRLRLATAVGAIAFGAGLMTMAGVGMYYETRADRTAALHRQEVATLNDAHRSERTAQEARHTREKKAVMAEIRDQLINIERLARGGK